MEFNPYQAPPEQNVEPSGTQRVLTIVGIMTVAVLIGVGLGGISGFIASILMVMIFEAADTNSASMVFVALGIGALVGFVVMVGIIAVIARLLLKHYEAK